MSYLGGKMGFSDFIANYVKNHDDVALENSALTWSEMSSLLGNMEVISEKISEIEEEIEMLF